MTTHQYTTPIVTTTAAGFRAWVRELSDALQLCGLVKTGDSGQIDIDTVALPGNSSAASGAAGFEVYTLNDSLSGSAPLFLKIYYGRNVSGGPQIYIEIGSGTNGLGGLTGIVITAKPVLRSVGVTITVNLPTFVCVTDGFIGVSFKHGLNASQSPYGFTVCRSTDGTGAPSPEGVVAYTGNQSPGIGLQSCGVFGQGEFYQSNNAYCMIVAGLGSTLVSGGSQVFKHYAAFPRVRPVAQMLTVNTNEIGAYTTFAAAPIGGNERTFICLGQLGFGNANVGNQSNYSAAMLWE